MAEWQMYAGHDDGLFWNPSPERWYPEAHGYDAVPVLVREDPEGTYWGWVDTDDHHPVMIQPVEALFSVQFPYGPKAEEKAGRGRIVRLTIEGVPHA